jgi:hypothetical protein
LQAVDDQRGEEQMPVENVTEKQVLEELLDLEPSRWPEVLDFIGYLKERESRNRARAGVCELTARDLLESRIVGLWADRDDIGNSLEYARQLRREAEHRRGLPQ